jgi:hypothetical protein
MRNTLQEKNKALVLEAFDTLFNKRDYVSAERFWSPDYIQHSAHIEPGPDDLSNLTKSAPATLKYEPGVDCGRWRFRDHPRAIFGSCQAREPDRNGHTTD